MKKNFKNIFNYILLLLITIIVLYFSLKDNFEVTLNELKKVNLFWIMFAVLFIIFYWIFRTLSIHVFVKKFKLRDSHPSQTGQKGKIPVPSLKADVVYPLRKAGLDGTAQVRK